MQIEPPLQSFSVFQQIPWPSGLFLSALVSEAPDAKNNKIERIVNKIFTSV